MRTPNEWNRGDDNSECMWNLRNLCNRKLPTQPSFVRPPTLSIYMEICIWLCAFRVWISHMHAAAQELEHGKLWIKFHIRMKSTYDFMNKCGRSRPNQCAFHMCGALIHSVAVKRRIGWCSTEVFYCTAHIQNIGNDEKQIKLSITSIWSARSIEIQANRWNFGERCRTFCEWARAEYSQNECKTCASIRGNYMGCDTQYNQASTYPFPETEYICLLTFVE